MLCTYNTCFFFAVKTNDQMLVIYLSSLIRSVIALHNLINNKVNTKYHCLLELDLIEYYVDSVDSSLEIDGGLVYTKMEGHE